MANVTAQQVKALRDRTGAGMNDCRMALIEAEGNEEKAVEIIQKKGLAKAAKKAGAIAAEGVIHSYIHSNARIGVLVEVNCETDFVARNDEFKELAHSIAMQIAATNPKYLSAEDIPAGSDDDPKEAALLSQAYIRDPKQTISDLVTAVAAKFKENVKVRRFARYELGAE